MGDTALMDCVREEGYVCSEPGRHSRSRSRPRNEHRVQSDDFYDKPLDCEHDRLLAQEPPSDDPGPVAAESVEGKFVKLKDEWKSKTRFLSNVTKRAMHPAYQQIIGMGKSAVPFILKDLANNGPDDWFWALTAITEENPITEDIAGNMAAMTEAWLRWGVKAGYLKDCHPKTSSVSQTSI